MSVSDQGRAGRARRHTADRRDPLDLESEVATLRRENERLAGLLGSVADWLWEAEIDAQGQMRYRRRAPVVERITGRSASFLDGGGIDRWLEIVHPDDRDRMKAALQVALGDGPQLVVEEYRLVRPDGSTRWVRDSVHVTGVVDGRRRVYGHLSDVTDRREAEEHLQRSEERFRAIAESAEDSIFIKDLDRRYIFVNPAMCDLLGRPAEELVGKTPTEVFGSEAAAIIDEVDRLAMAGEVADAIRSLEINGQQKIFHTIQVPLKDVAGEINAICGIVRDVTERHCAEEERRAMEVRLLESQKLESLGVLAGGIAHDFNNLLVGILGNASLATLDVPPDSPARQALETIESTAMRAAELVEQLLAYAGRGARVVETVDLLALVEETANLLGVSIPEGVSLRLDLEEVPPIRADATQLRQVAVNLITNAIDAIGGGAGSVTLRTRTIRSESTALATGGGNGSAVGGRMAVLEVSDSGCGMDEATQKRIFDPFFTTKTNGRGLGLAAVLGIVRGHGGVVDVRSEPGKGTRFRVALPASGDGRSSSAEQTAANGRAPIDLTLLVVDDDPIVRQVATRMVERLGANAFEVASGAEAIAAFEREADRFDCVLLDLKMPKMSGEECYKRLVEIRPDLPVLLMSGHSRPVSLPDEGDNPPLGFLKKPFDLAALKRELHELLYRA